jgi:hypothetical protein
VGASVPRRSTNKIAVNFKDQLFQMHMPRTVKPATGPAPFQAETILEIAPQPGQDTFWTETDTKPLIPGNLGPYVFMLRQRDLLDQRRAAEPIPVGVAVSDREQKPRMVVVGDYSFASNTAANSRVSPYYDFLTSSMEWLAQRPANIGIKPKESGSFALGANVSWFRLIWLPVGLTVLAVVGIGTGIWVVRRR